MLAERVREWTREWVEEGLEKGREEALKKGVLTGQRELLLELLEAKFGEVPRSVASVVRKGGSEEVKEWVRPVLEAHEIQEIFGNGAPCSTPTVGFRRCGPTFGNGAPCSAPTVGFRRCGPTYPLLMPYPGG